MGEADTFYCSRCKLHQTIKKKIDIWSVPDVSSLPLILDTRVHFEALSVSQHASVQKDRLLCKLSARGT